MVLRCLWATILFAFSALVGFAQARPYFTEPALSPDRKEIAFVSGGDIWTVPSTGGVASLLVSHTANEGPRLKSCSPNPKLSHLESVSNRGRPRRAALTVRSEGPNSAGEKVFGFFIEPFL
jgi:predicted secreted protein